MKYITSVFFLLCMSTASIAATVPNVVLGYECRHATPDTDGFSCRGETSDGQTRLYIHFTNWEKLSPEKREYAEYRFNLLLLRYFQLGGKFFVTTSEAWPNGVRQECSRGKSTMAYFCNNNK